MTQYTRNYSNEDYPGIQTKWREKWVGQSPQIRINKDDIDFMT